MKYLFLHNNYPAQYVHLARALTALGNQVVFLSRYQKDTDCGAVRKIKIPLRKPWDSPDKAEQTLMDLLRIGEDFANTMLGLRKKGFVPDLICDHPGFGCGMYVPDIFPDSARVSYCEWFYTKSADFAYFHPGKAAHPTEFAANRQRNLYILDGLRESDAGISPTQWQKSCFPEEVQHKIRVIHDGVDTDFFTPGSDTIPGIDFSGATELVTYATRGLEPYRGFPEFYRSLPEVLESRPHCHVIIMANDSVHYGSKRPDGKTWGEHVRSSVPLDSKRVHFLKFGSLEQYRALLRASSVHVYLTVPFVLSWSLLEAMSCGCHIVASDTEPVREVIRHEHNGLLVPFPDSNALAQSIIQTLEKPSAELRTRARQTVIDNYALKDMLPAHLALLRDAMTRRYGLGKALRLLPYA